MVAAGGRLRHRGLIGVVARGRPAAGSGAAGAARRPVGVRRPAGRLRPAGPLRRGAGTGAGPRRPLDELVDTVRHGLDLTWARVQLDDARRERRPRVGRGRRSSWRSATATRVVGRIECGPRRDGNPLLAEDRRLLGLARRPGRHGGPQPATGRRAGRAAAPDPPAGGRAGRVPRPRRRRPGRRAPPDPAGPARRRPAGGRGADREARPGPAAAAGAATRAASGCSAELQADLGDAAGRRCARSRTPSTRRSSPTADCSTRSRRRRPGCRSRWPYEADPALREVRFPPRIEATAWYAARRGAVQRRQARRRRPGRGLRWPSRTAGCARGARRRPRLRPERARAASASPGWPTGSTSSAVRSWWRARRVGARRCAMDIPWAGR